MTGTEVQRATRCRVLLEHGLAIFLEEAEQSLIEVTVATVLAGQIDERVAIESWARLATLRGLRKDAERRARSLQPLTVPIAGGV